MSRGRAYPDIRDYEASSHQRIISNKASLTLNMMFEP